MFDSPHEITIAGSPFERGRAFGAAVATEVRAFLGDNLGRLNLLRQTPLSEVDAARVTQPYGAVLQSHLPALFEEVQGIADGAGIPVWQALLLQLRRELGHVPGQASDCTLFGVSGENCESVLAQTIDLDGGLSDLGRVLRVLPADAGEPRQMLYTFCGLAGYLGLNDRGLAVGINMVLSDGWRPGISPYLLVRHLLAQESIEACLAELGRLPRSSSRTLTLCDSRRCVSVEMTVDELRTIEGDVLVHTNHYLHPGLQGFDRANVLSRRSSRARYRRISELVASESKARAAERAFGWLSDHDGGGGLAICCHGTGDVRRSETVAAVVMRPSRGSLLVRRGAPCRSREQEYSI